MALPAALTTPASAPWLTLVSPWLYPLYYVCLFIPRQIDDDAQMRAKYALGSG